VFVPAKVKEVYLYHLLDGMAAKRIRSAIIFVGTCRGCQLLALLLRELGLPCAELHSGACVGLGWGVRVRVRGRGRGGLGEAFGSCATSILSTSPFNHLKSLNPHRPLPNP